MRVSKQNRGVMAHNLIKKRASRSGHNSNRIVARKIREVVRETGSIYNRAHDIFENTRLA